MPISLCAFPAAKMQTRVAGFWESTIQPHMRHRRSDGQEEQPTFLLVSHANAIRALMAHIDGVQVMTIQKMRWGGQLGAHFFCISNNA